VVLPLRQSLNKTTKKTSKVDSPAIKRSLKPSPRKVLISQRAVLNLKNLSMSATRVISLNLEMSTRMLNNKLRLHKVDQLPSSLPRPKVQPEPKINSKAFRRTKRMTSLSPSPRDLPSLLGH
jgi:hypothetical protein